MTKPETTGFAPSLETLTALARRWYIHVKWGGKLTERDMERLVEALENLAHDR